MDTAFIAEYYREGDPKKRLALLEKSIEAGEEPEANRIRKEFCETRYFLGEKKGSLADGYLRFWMTLEFNKNAGNRLFGLGRARKDIKKELDRIGYTKFHGKSELYDQLLYREFCHLIRLYMTLCTTDRSYNTMLCGLVKLKEENAAGKLKKDVYETAILLPRQLNMTEELDMLMRAARQVYEEHFPGEGGMPE